MKNTFHNFSHIAHGVVVSVEIFLINNSSFLLANS